MYSGTRRGCIFTHDLRSRSTLPVSSMSHKHAIAHLYLSTDENVIIASDVSAKVILLYHVNLSNLDLLLSHSFLK